MKQKIKTGILMTALAVGSLHIVNRCAQALATVKNLLDKHKGAFYDWRFRSGLLYKNRKRFSSPACSRSGSGRLFLRMGSLC